MNIERYGRLSKAFHWATVLALTPAMLIGLWWILVDLDTDSGWEQFELLISWHANFGLTLIIIMLPRIIWRALNGAPEPFTESPVQKKVAKTAHLALYGLGILTPVSGWLGSALDGAVFSYFSLFNIPAFFGKHPDLARLMTSVHIYASWALIAFVGLHILAVFYHQFWLKDKLLKHML